MRERLMRMLYIHLLAWSQMPRTLFDLWTEYQYGIGGQKPAKDYSCRKRKGEVSLPLPKGSLGYHSQACVCRLHSRSSNQQNLLSLWMPFECDKNH